MAQWATYETVYVRQPKTLPTPGSTVGVAAFDFDGTFIWTASGRAIYRVSDDTDWVLTSAQLPGFLQSSVQNGWLVVIFSNQKVSAKDIPNRISRFDKVVAELGIDPYIFFATKDDKYRKPEPGMWQLFLGLSQIVPHPGSFYSGDAVGGDDPNPLYRWADTDSKFAQNIGVTFRRPEDVIPPTPEPSPSPAQELVILVGQPGSGKSTFAKKWSAQYTVVSGDEMKSNKNKMQAAVHRALGEKKSVIVDATNPTRSGRAEYIQLAKQLGVPVRILWFPKPGEAFNALRPVPVSSMALTMYSSRFERPTVDEGAVVERGN